MSLATLHYTTFLPQAAPTLHHLASELTKSAFKVVQYAVQQLR